MQHSAFSLGHYRTLTAFATPTSVQISDRRPTKRRQETMDAPEIMRIHEMNPAPRHAPMLLRRYRIIVNQPNLLPNYYCHNEAISSLHALSRDWKELANIRMGTMSLGKTNAARDSHRRLSQLSSQATPVGAFEERPCARFHCLMSFEYALLSVSTSSIFSNSHPFPVSARPGVQRGAIFQN